MSLNMRYLLPLLASKIMPSDQIVSTQVLANSAGLIKVQGVLIEERRHSRSRQKTAVFDIYNKAPTSSSIGQQLTHMQNDEITTMEALKKILTDPLVYKKKDRCG